MATTTAESGGEGASAATDKTNRRSGAARPIATLSSATLALCTESAVHVLIQNGRCFTGRKPLGLPRRIFNICQNILLPFDAGRPFRH